MRSGVFLFSLQFLLIVYGTQETQTFPIQLALQIHKSYKSHMEAREVKDQQKANVISDTITHEGWWNWKLSFDAAVF